MLHTSYVLCHSMSISNACRVMKFKHPPLTQHEVKKRFIELVKCVHPDTLHSTQSTSTTITSVASTNNNNSNSNGKTTTEEKKQYDAHAQMIALTEAYKTLKEFTANRRHSVNYNIGNDNNCSISVNNSNNRTKQDFESILERDESNTASSFVKRYNSAESTQKIHLPWQKKRRMINYNVEPAYQTNNLIDDVSWHEYLHSHTLWKEMQNKEKQEQQSTLQTSRIAS